MDREKPRRGDCIIKQSTGIILFILLILLVIGVGVLVYFTSRSDATDCYYNYPGSTGTGTGGSDLDTQSRSSQIQFCNSLGVRTNSCFGSQTCIDSRKPTTQSTLTTSAPPGGTNNPNVTPPPVIDVRIPTKLYPDHYNVELQPHLYSGPPENFTFDGQVDVFLTCREATDKLYIHIYNLDVHNTTIKFRGVDDNTTPPGWSHWTYDEVRQFFILHLTSTTTVGKQYVFSTRFTGPLTDGLLGLYRSSYKINNETRWIALAVLEPTEARKTFPCFDEPDIKATFNVTIVRKSNMTALSNMPLSSSTQRVDNWIADHFEKSVKMSTYLLAFVVCDFTYKEAFTSRGTRFRIWARPDAVAAGEADYALDIGVRLLTYFEDYFQIPYPLPKLDSVAVPTFIFAALETWGCISYWEPALLYSPQDPLSAKEFVTIVSAHELAHQWFGNLVSPAWWDDLWLNEGFAVYVSYIGTDYVQPDWKMMDMFIQNYLQSAFDPDSGISSHPVFVPVNHPDEIWAIFDTITYNKGASVIRMMDFILGRQTFQQGLTNYLKEHAYDTANNTDLWRALANQARAEGNQVNVPEVMDTWIKQMGYPVVTVNINRQRKTALVTQKHFVKDETKQLNPKYPSPYGYKWMIPFTYTTDVEDNFENPELVWMEKSDVSLTNLPNNIKWIIGNIGAVGYYRMNYDEETWQNIIEQLTTNHQVIPMQSRAQLIDDSLNLGRYGVIDQVWALKLINYLKNEREFLPWNIAIAGTTYIQGMLSKTGSFGSFQMFMTDQVKPVYDQLGGWSISTTDSHFERKLRLRLVETLCRYGNQECRNEASTLYSKWMEDPDGNKVEPDLRKVTYCYGIKNGGYSEWEFALNRLKQESNAGEKKDLVYALSCSEIPWILNKYLHLAIESPQDFEGAFLYVAQNPVGNYLVFDVMKSNFMKVALILQVQRLDDIFNYFYTDNDCQQILDALSEHAEHLGPTAESFEQLLLEQCEPNVQWLNKNMDQIATWLNEQYPMMP